MTLSNNTIDSIRDKTDIVELIGQYVRLKKKGQNFLGLCPFHQEKTPSFTVNPVKNIWHCFGCGSGGNVFGFLTRIENINFIEAARMLAEKAGITLEEDKNYSPAINDKKNINYEIMKQALVYFEANLSEERVSKYLAQRKINTGISADMHLGYAKAQPNSLYLSLKKHYSDNDLLDTGLFVDSHSGILDRFIDRLIFPIFDLQNRVVAFGGRTLGNDTAKYINSPETMIYHKSDHLFALNTARPFIKENDNSLILVEGYMDALALYQSGVRNVSAVLGTSLTPQQVKLAERYAENIYLCFDADDAGQKAVIRAVELLRNTQSKVKVINLLDCKDPDDFVKKYGGEKFAEQINTALPLLKFALYHIINQYSPLGKAAQLGIEDKSRIIKDVKEVYAEQDEMIKNEYIGELAQILKLDNEFIKAKFYSYKIFNMRNKAVYYNTKQIGKQEKQEKEILSVLINDTDLRKEFVQKFSEYDFEDKDHQEIFKLLRENIDKKVDELLSDLPAEISKRITEFSMLESIINKRLHIEDHFKSLQQRNKNKRIAFLKSEINRLEKLADFDKLTLHQKELSDLIKQS
ncbi:MAG: DNA primase [Candidatus Margulisbacteria bacterium]|nr:DNA primase [Candidatus Margulisiibacteriota bacterium]